MDEKYLKLRKQLTFLGYADSFSMDCMPIIENLTSDLLQTTSSLQYYMKEYKSALRERDNLKEATEPYMCDNAKLIRENNELHQALLKYKEDLALKKNDEKIKIDRLENEISALRDQNKSLKLQNREYQLKNICADTISSSRKSVFSCKNIETRESTKTRISPESRLCASCLELKNELDDHLRDLIDCKSENKELVDKIRYFKNQISNRNSEIQRLNALLEGGRPISAIRKDCRCINLEDERLAEFKLLLKNMEDENENLSAQLKESLSKQHEAMSKAVQLAEENESIRERLDETNQVALRAESECNKQLKEKCDIIDTLQEQLQTTRSHIGERNKTYTDMTDSHIEYAADVERKTHEINVLKKSLDSINEINERLLEENRKLLNANKQFEEILQRNSGTQSASDRVNNKNIVFETCDTCGKLKVRYSNMGENIENQPRSNRNQNQYCYCESFSKDILMKLIENERKFYENHINDIKSKLNQQTDFVRNYTPQTPEPQYGKLKEERDFYFREYRNLKDKFPREEFVTELQNKICTLEQHIHRLEKDNKTITDRNIALKTELEDLQNQRQRSAHNYELTHRTQTLIEHLERDLSHAREQIRQLENEREMLCNKLKLVSATNQLSHREDIFSKRSYEMGTPGVDIITAQNQRLQQECSTLRENLKISETDLLHIKTLYNQLKSVQSENDKNVSDLQVKLNDAKREIHMLKNNLASTVKIKDDLEYEVKLLKTDKTSLKDNLTQIDKERDKLVMDIDDKTEKVSSLQHHLRSKDTEIELLENKVTELNRKLDLLTGENATLEHKCHDMQTHSESLSLELDTITKQRDNAVIENRRLQSDLAAVTSDLRSLKREYELSRKEVEEMKQQLQHYVDEVRRIEDILSRKEAERTEMLDQFASLTHETAVLESNNHSLENEAASKNVQLQAANEKLDDLERKLKSRESIIDMQEEKINTLMFKMSSLETEVTKHKEAMKTTEQMLTSAQEKCSTLENQKRSILVGVGETESEKKNLEYNVDMLNREKRKLEENSIKEKARIESLESLLAESRKEVVELKLSIEDSADEIRRLKRKIESLQKHIDVVENESLSSRQRTEEAARGLQDLQFQMTDERYQRVRSQNRHLSGTL